MTDGSAGLGGSEQARRGRKRGAVAAMLVWLLLATACGSQATADTTSHALAFEHASRGALHLFGFGTTGVVIPNGTRHLTKEQCSTGFGELDEAIQLEPRLEFAYTSRASAYLALGEHVRAVEDLTTVIELQPQEAWLQATYLQRALVHSLMGLTDRATHDWAVQARLGPGPGSLDEYVRLRAELPPAFDCAAAATLATVS
ncbi:MAG: hypothetical protein IH862_00820 [Chloroflexi bacterium]|nr:hypothetical protein [Chloroflexota bacterium]